MNLRLLFAAAVTAIVVSGPSISIAEEINQLTESEQRSGWKLLFDGKTTDGWRNYKKDDVSDGWKIENGELTWARKGAGDIITKDQYKHFELQLEYKISKAGNSGLMFHVTEEEQKPWQTGPEIQIQDNVDGHDPQKAGWLYQLYKPRVPNWVKNASGDSAKSPTDATRPAGEWNHLYVRIAEKNSQICMNGVNYCKFTKGNGDWNKRVAESKFAKFENFGKPEQGHLCLQDHGNVVSFRNIKIRSIGEGGDVVNPVHGEIAVEPKPAFPKLVWEGWEGNSDDGKKRPLRTIVMTQPRDGDESIYTASQKGMIHQFQNDPEATDAKLFLDLRDKVKSYKDRGANEEGLLGLAMHPEFSKNGKFYVYYTSSKDEKVSIISEFTKPADAAIADTESERVLMRIQQPYQNHNGGSIEFGHDGYLYIGMGDGGLANDPHNNGQDLSTLMGTILRIDVNARDGDKQYGIPSDNPFLNREGARPEIYAYGLRNVWRMSFDPANGKLWMADVGQELWEEINLIEKGGNYGWSVREGAHPFKNGEPNTDPLLDPIWEYDHQIGRSITGGHVCRSNRVPELNGKYIYADYVSGRIWALAYDPSGAKPIQNFNLIDGGMPVLAFGQDTAGEVYYLIESTTGQTIYKFDGK